MRTVRKRGTITVLVIALLLLLVGSIICFYFENQCRSSCSTVLNAELERLSQMPVAPVQQQVEEDQITFAVRGDFDPVDVRTDGEFVFSFMDYFDKSTVNGTRPVYSFAIEANPEIMQAVVLALESNPLDQQAELTITYSKKESTISAIFTEWTDFLRAQFGDRMVDLSRYYSVSDVTIAFQTESDIRGTCDNLTTEENLLSTVVDIRNAVYKMVSESTEYQGDNVDRIRNVGRLVCSLCSSSCELLSKDVVAYDYLFFPMLDYAISEVDEEAVDPTYSLEILADSYGIEEDVSFSDFIDSRLGTVHVSDSDYLWGTKSLCLPYVANESANGSPDNSESSLYQKICFDLGKKTYSAFTVHQSETENMPITDEVFWDYVEILLEDPTAFAQLEYMQGQSPDTALFLNHAADTLVYGYETNNDLMIRYGNERLLRGMWGLFEKYNVDGSNRLSTGHYVRRITNALLIKKYYASQAGNSDRARDVIDRYVARVGGASNLEFLYGVSGGYALPIADADMTYLPMLSDILSVWLLDKGFYDENFEPRIEDVISDWFYRGYLSSSCAKADFNLLYGTTSDGTCSTSVVSIVENTSTGIYLMIYNKSLETN